LDFLDPWDIENILDTILHPEHEWDAVFANGAYDLFALRDREFPIGFELLGEKYWQNLDKMRVQLSLGGPWRKVYSAFGGLGIYKRQAMKGCRYSGVVTKDLEKAVLAWLERAQGTCFWEEYQHLLTSTPVIQLHKEHLNDRKRLPDAIGLRLHGSNLTWFSCTARKTLPWTCEHVTFHASMAAKGHDKLFINPSLRSCHP
jgi:hypothetical protein